MPEYGRTHGGAHLAGCIDRPDTNGEVGLAEKDAHHGTPDAAKAIDTDADDCLRGTRSWNSGHMVISAEEVVVSSENQMLVRGLLRLRG